jgi:protein ImuB
MDWRSSRHHDHPPIVFAGRHANRMCLTVLDAAAERLNLKLGQGVSEARAIFPELDVMDEDDDADAALLMALSDWCDRYTPLVTLEGRNGLSLDITGCADYGGGEQGLLGNASRRLRQMGFDVKGTLASFPGVWSDSASAADGTCGGALFRSSDVRAFSEISQRHSSRLGITASDHGSLIRGL